MSVPSVLDAQFIELQRRAKSLHSGYGIYCDDASSVADVLIDMASALAQQRAEIAELKAEVEKLRSEVKS